MRKGNNMGRFLYYHKNFNDLSEKELDTYLTFLYKVLFNLDGFDVWTAENCFSDDWKWNKEALERYNALLGLRRDLDDQLIKLGE